MRQANGRIQWANGAANGQPNMPLAVGVN